MHIDLALDPYGDRHNLVQRERAVCWLLGHAEVAFPKVARRAEEHRGGNVLELLGRFDRAESTPILDAALHDGGASSENAAFALANARDPAAAAALVGALASDNPVVVIAALDGLRVRADPSSCDAVVALVAADHPEVRYSAVHAAGTIGCLDRARLRRLAKRDPDADVRALAGRLAR